MFPLQRSLTISAAWITGNNRFLTIPQLRARVTSYGIPLSLRGNIKRGRPRGTVLFPEAAGYFVGFVLPVSGIFMIPALTLTGRSSTGRRGTRGLLAAGCRAVTLHVATRSTGGCRAIALHALRGSA